MRRGASLLVVVVTGLVTGLTGAARAQDGPVVVEPAPAGRPATSADADGAALEDAKLIARLKRLRAEPGGTVHLLASVGLGKGLRLNNPYRLDTQLGDDAASASLTATYVDVGLGAAYGSADGIHHGLALHFGGAAEGISQTFLTPTYLAALRPGPRWLVVGRLGPTFLLSPDANVGGEIAGGGTWFATAGLGLGAEVLLDAFYGAATLDSTATVIPLLSVQLQLVLDLEALP